MRDYETVLILKPDAPEAQVKALAKKIEKVLSGKPGKILKTEDWGLKKFAYEIKKEKKGHYLFWSFAQVPSVLGQLDRAVRFDESVLRYMTVTLGEHGKVKKKDLEKAKKMEQQPPQQDDGEDGPRQARPVKIDYKDPMTLNQFISERGKIVPRRNSRFDATQQRALATAIKRARQLALLSYTSGHFMPREQPQHEPRQEGGFNS